MPIPFLALGAASKVFRSLPLSVYLGLAVAAGFGVMQWKHSREVNALTKDVAAIAQQRDEQVRQKLEYVAALSDVTANRDALQSELRRQNDAIGQLETARKAAESMANIEAIRAFSRGLKAADALRAPTTTVPSGAPGMNTWMAERFQVTP